MDFANNNTYYATIKIASYKALYGKNTNHHWIWMT